MRLGGSNKLLCFALLCFAYAGIGGGSNKLLFRPELLCFHYLLCMLLYIVCIVCSAYSSA